MKFQVLFLSYILQRFKATRKISFHKIAKAHEFMYFAISDNKQRIITAGSQIVMWEINWEKSTVSNIGTVPLSASASVEFANDNADVQISFFRLRKSLLFAR